MGAREWLEIGGEKPLVMSKLGCADGCGRQMGGENCADGCGRRGCEGAAARTAAGGKWVRRIARTAADGVGARERLEMVRAKKPLGMSELGCADGCGRRGCKGVAGNGSGRRSRWG